VLPTAALQRIRNEIAQGCPELALARPDGAVVHARYLDRFECPLGALWMLSVPQMAGSEVLLAPDEVLQGHVRVGQRMLNFSCAVVAAQAVLERDGTAEDRVCLVAEPEDYSEVQRRRWHRVRAESSLVGPATLYYEASRVIVGEAYEVRRGMERAAVDVLDLSGGGVSFRAGHEFAHQLREGDLVRLRLELSEGQEPFGFSAQVRNCAVDDEGVRYGVAFHGDDRLFGEISARALHLVFLLQADS
jgi:c-di-GMP-binding flagellar brake protein YcgR